MTAEQKIDKAMRQEPSVLVMGGRKFRMAPPCAATLYKISGMTSQLPQMKIEKYTDENGVDKLDSLGSILRNAKDMEIIGDIIATAIVGEQSPHPIFGKLLSIPRHIRYAFVRWFINNRVTPNEWNDIFNKELAGMMQTDFFLLTGIFLSAINMTKPTKSQTTAPTPLSRGY